MCDMYNRHYRVYSNLNHIAYKFLDMFLRIPENTFGNYNPNDYKRHNLLCFDNTRYIQPVCIRLNIVRIRNTNMIPILYV